MKRNLKTLNPKPVTAGALIITYTIVGVPYYDFKLWYTIPQSFILIIKAPIILTRS